MAKWTQKYIAKQKSWTDECYKQALMEHYPGIPEYFRRRSVYDMKVYLAENTKLLINSPEITQIYYEKLIQLPTRKLELIVEAYQRGKQFRSGETIEVIMTELLERATCSESKG